MVKPIHEKAKESALGCCYDGYLTYKISIKKGFVVYERIFPTKGFSHEVEAYSSGDYVFVSLLNETLYMVL